MPALRLVLRPCMWGGIKSSTRQGWVGRILAHPSILWHCHDLAPLPQTKVRDGIILMSTLVLGWELGSLEVYLFTPWIALGLLGRRPITMNDEGPSSKGRWCWLEKVESELALRWISLIHLLQGSWCWPHVPNHLLKHLFPPNHYVQSVLTSWLRLDYSNNNAYMSDCIATSDGLWG